MRKMMLWIGIGVFLAFAGCGQSNQEALGNAPCSCTAKSDANQENIIQQ
ncbi:MAG: hypothetical protein K2H55_01505 [Helicobacter sp.]|nr:hypothetical protein [Helicobacter sp.]MDE5816166.1 hypothetical protein [Helicobacter sp.]MDE6045255.1 hypothetical protein [Helicobacter sp.]MDE7195474.1 hypothetical protein [Helicobacter sp.]